MGRPWPAAAVAMLCWRLLSHPAPEGALLMASDVALAVLFGARSQSQAMTSHRAAHVVRAPRSPRRPPGRSVGHTNRPMIAYSRTAPGAPVSGLAVLLNRNPKASALHHTMSDQAKDSESAAFTAGR